MSVRTFKTRRNAAQSMREVEHQTDKGTFGAIRTLQATTLKETLETSRDTRGPQKKGGAVERIRINAMLATKYAP